MVPPPALSPELSIIVPCRDEAAVLPRYESELFPALAGLGRSFELILVDDGSTDRTGPACEALALRREDVVVLRLWPNRGLGGALRAGFTAAKGRWIATLDADLSFRPEDLGALLAAAEESGADLAAGSPYLRRGDLAGVPWSRRLPSLMLNALYRGLFGFSLTAYTPILRLYRAEWLKSLPLVSEGFEINAEIAARALLGRRGVAEVPAPLSERRQGASKLRRFRELSRHARLILRLLAEPTKASGSAKSANFPR